MYRLLIAFALTSLASLAAEPTPSAPPRVGARLRAFCASKEKQARSLTEGKPVTPEIWAYFALAAKGDWDRVKKASDELFKRSSQDNEDALALHSSPAWPPFHETFIAHYVMMEWPERYYDRFASEIITAIPPGSIYFGGDDAGRGIITVESKSHLQADPFFTLTQNNLVDGTYRAYLRRMYGDRIKLPSEAHFAQTFQDYVKDAAKRKSEGNLKAGEMVGERDGRTFVHGETAVMFLNVMLVKAILDANLDREVFIEERDELDQLYPLLSPHGLIMQINPRPVAALSDDVVARDRRYWSQLVGPMIGDWVRDDTPLDTLTGFARRTFVTKDRSQFQGDPTLITTYAARATFARCRAAIGGIYAWRANNASTPQVRQRMERETSLAFKQAYALCPNMPDVVTRYGRVLESQGQDMDAVQMATTALQIGGEEREDTDQLRALVDHHKEKTRLAPKK